MLLPIATSCSVHHCNSLLPKCLTSLYLIVVFVMNALQFIIQGFFFNLPYWGSVSPPSHLFPTVHLCRLSAENIDIQSQIITITLLVLLRPTLQFFSVSLWPGGTPAHLAPVLCLSPAVEEQQQTHLNKHHFHKKMSELIDDIKGLENLYDSS